MFERIEEIFYVSVKKSDTKKLKTEQKKSIQLEKKLGDCKKMISELQRAYNSVVDQNDQLENKLALLNTNSLQTSSQFENKVTNLKKSIRLLESQTMKLEDEKMSYELKLDQMNSWIQNKKNELDDANSCIENLKSKMHTSSLSFGDQIAKEKQEITQELKSEHRKEINKLNDIFRKKENSHFVELSRNKSSFEKESKVLSQENQTLEKRIKDLEGKIENLLEQQSQYRKSLEDYKLKSQSSSRNISEFTNKENQMSDDTKSTALTFQNSIGNKTFSSKKKKGDLAMNVLNKTPDGKRCRDLEGELSSLKNRHTSQSIQSEDLVYKNSQLNQKATKLMQELKESKTQISEYKRQNQIFEDSLSTKDDQIRELTEAVSNLEEKILRLQEEIVEEQNKNKDNNKVLKLERREKANIERELDQLQFLHENYTKEKEETDSLKNKELESLRFQKINLENKIITSCRDFEIRIEEEREKRGTSDSKLQILTDQLSDSQIITESSQKRSEFYKKKMNERMMKSCCQSGFLSVIDSNKMKDLLHKKLFEVKEIKITLNKERQSINDQLMKYKEMIFILMDRCILRLKGEQKKECYNRKTVDRLNTQIIYLKKINDEMAVQMRKSTSIQRQNMSCTKYSSMEDNSMINSLAQISSSVRKSQFTYSKDSSGVQVFGKAIESKWGDQSHLNDKELTFGNEKENMGMMIKNINQKSSFASNMR